MKRALFLDRDGTLMEEKEYLHRPEEVAIHPGAVEALKRLQEAGFLLILVTNQSGVGRGYFTLADVDRVHERVQAELRAGGVNLTHIYVAPEAPGEPSHGRKPSPQFLREAAATFGIDLGQSYMAGDKMSDVECGRRAGVRTSFLVRTGYGKEAESRLEPDLDAVCVVDDIAEVAGRILEDIP